MDRLPCCKACEANQLDCIEEALNKIKEHYLFFKKKAEENQKQIIYLEERNGKLQAAVDILRHEKIPNKKDGKQFEEVNAQFDEMSFLSTEASPVSHSDLNMAIHSENQLNASSLSCIYTQNETIAETESFGLSPQKLKTPHCFWKKRRELMRSQNKIPVLEKKLNKVSKNKESYLEKKERPGRPVTMINETITKQNSTTLRDLINIRNEKKINLSLNKKVGKKKLTFESQKNSIVSYNDQIQNKHMEDIIDSPEAGSKFRKPSRNLLLRNDNCGGQSPVPIQMSNLKQPKLEKDLENDYFFDFNITMSPLKRKKSLSENSLSINMSLANKSNNSSCVLLTPDTQDIIFVDESEDSIDTTKQIKTMDIMADILKTDDETLTILKCLESRGIKQQQKTKGQNIHMKASSARSFSTKIKEEEVSQVQSSPDDNETTFVDEAVLAPLFPSIPKKREIETDVEDEDYDNSLKRGSKNMFKTEESGIVKSKTSDIELNSEDDDLFKIPMPIVIKKEKGISNDKKSLKERFSINCDDCEKYLEIVGDRLTDRQIEDIVMKCTHFKDLMRTRTPEGFWNPLLLSFAEDDPRNQILVDDRFSKKKKAENKE